MWLVSIDIYKENMICRYIIRPLMEIINEPCYASFVKHYQLLLKRDKRI